MATVKPYNGLKEFKSKRKLEHVPVITKMDDKMHTNSRNIISTLSINKIL